ncbi:putative bicarbonate transporter, IctB family [filamentous cyanobacterium LEGE 11480]|uniref:Bicarbonate transporter, IctB family n=1 Tax=Romeriopsis navalis LEGE 11480 TaxID=2777977 RepID=A0A928VHS5_9CYAN|nr:IctB family putative bicarbonate transporter [Romeriopsis navalis]MBE9028590.1 putative bicarbonate transporter, IctB family [Romeriopsis navalis LEGE 11480]
MDSGSVKARPSIQTIWQQLTLSQLSLSEWRGASWLYRIVGMFHNWKYGSWCLQHSDAISLWLLGLFFGLAPFVSTSLMSVLLVGCAGFWFLLTIADGEQGKVRSGLTAIHLLVMLFWGISVVSIGTSPVKVAAIKGLAKLTLYLLLFVFMARVLRSRKLRDWLIGIYLHVSLIVSTYGIRQWIFGAEPLATWSDPTSEFADVTRVYSYLRNPNLLAGYLIPAIAFSIMAIFAWKRRGPKFLAAVMAVINTACLIFTFSRAGWIALVVMLVSIALLIGYWLHLYKRAWVLPAIVGGMVGFIALSVIFVPPVRSRVLSIFAMRGDSSNNFRMNVWTSVFQMIKDRPILGIGPGNDAFNLVYPIYSKARFTALGAYSVPLEIIVEAGFIGFACFNWLVLVTFGQAFEQLNRLRQANDRQGYWLIAAVATIVGLMFQGLFDTVWYRPQVNSLWWFAVAIIAGIVASQPTDFLTESRESIAQQTDKA